MGSSVSHAAAPPPPPPGYSAPAPAYTAPPPYAAVNDPLLMPQAEAKEEEEEKVDYLNLRCPVPYEEIQREAFMALKPELFDGFRFDLNKVFGEKFALNHSLSMGSLEIPSQGADVIKVPTSSYEFGASFVDPKVMLIGRISQDGRLNARVKYDLPSGFCLKINAQLTNEPHYSQGMGTLDYKPHAAGKMLLPVEPNYFIAIALNRWYCGLAVLMNLESVKEIQGKDSRSQFQFGNNGFFGGNYIQSVTKNLSLGTEAFWLGEQRKSGVGFLARYDTKKMVATGQIASTGVISLSYVQKVSDKVSLATDFMYNHMSRDVTASVGYDYILRQSRLRGKLDTNGVVSSLLEEQMAPGLNFILSAEVDHWKKDYKFGFGLTFG